MGGMYTNGLLRQYFPQGDRCLHPLPKALNAVVRQLNGRPRQTLRWMKPCEVFTKTVAITTLRPPGVTPSM